MKTIEMKIRGMEYFWQFLRASSLITNNKFDMGRGKSPGKGSRKMEGYFETIESRGGGIVGSAAELFWTA